MRIETRGAEIGRCNICGLTEKLTEDHIPPKGVPRVGRASLIALADDLNVDRRKGIDRLFQRGITYRSLCRICNSERLGGEFDPELVRLTRAIDNELVSRLYAPIRLEVKLNRAIRSVIGHFLAHGINRHRWGDLNSELTDFVLNTSHKLPDDVRIYCWLYPDNRQVVVQSAVSTNNLGSGEAPTYFGLIKFYPLAFMVTQDDVAAPFLALLQIDKLLTTEIDEPITLELSINYIPPLRWPENPTSNGAVLHTQGSTVAVPHKKPGDR